MYAIAPKKQLILVVPAPAAVLFFPVALDSEIMRREFQNTLSREKQVKVSGYFGVLSRKLETSFVK